MKKFFFFFVLFTSITFSQNTISGKVEYLTSIEAFSNVRVDSLAKKAKVSKKMESWYKGIFKNTKDVISTLTFVNGESLYSLEGKMQKNTKARVNLTEGFAGGNTKYYTNLKDKEYFKQLRFDEYLRVEMPLKNWQITNETKQIGEYVCFKAVTSTNNKQTKYSKTVTAWFTPTIPVSFGPKEYFGLPGLILEIILGEKIKIKATKISLNPNEKLIIKKPRKGKRMTHKEYQEMNANFFKYLDKRRR